MSEAEYCPYCESIPYVGPKEVAGPRTPFDEILDLGRGVVLVPTVGMLTLGYLLAVSRKHLPCFARMQTAELGELDSYLRDRVAELERVFGRYLVFEHGPGSGRGKGVCVDHAHLHLIPLSEKLKDEVLKGFRWRELKALTDLHNFAKSQYVFMKIGEECRIAEVTHLESQWIRRRLAASLGTDRSWDWAVYTGAEELKITRLRLEENGLIDKWRYSTKTKLRR